MPLKERTKAECRILFAEYVYADINGCWRRPRGYYNCPNERAWYKRARRRAQRRLDRLNIWEGWEDQ